MSDSEPFKSNFSRGRSSAGQFAIACVYLFFGTGVLSRAFMGDRVNHCPLYEVAALYDVLDLDATPRASQVLRDKATMTVRGLIFAAK